nr:tigger transposable element-derived protein 4-like [Hydra vulgaris]
MSKFVKFSNKLCCWKILPSEEFSNNTVCWKILQKETDQSLRKLSVTQWSSRIEAVKPLAKKPRKILKLHRQKELDLPSESSYLRSTMDQERYWYLMILSIESDLANNVSYEEIKDKTKLLTSLEKNGTKSKRTKLRSGNFKNVDKTIYTWFVAKRSQKVPIDGTILKEKALKFAEALGELDFKASDCWFHNWKERNGISFKIISGESAAVTNNMTASWNETTLPTLLMNYKLENIFNADEFGLFYQCLPNKTYHLSREKCFGGKNSKVRLTGIAAGSATGEKLPMFVIGKSKNPRCFKHIKQLACTYKNQLKSWMTGDLFTEWLCSTRSLDVYIESILR